MALLTLCSSFSSTLKCKFPPTNQWWLLCISFGMCHMLLLSFDIAWLRWAHPEVISKLMQLYAILIAHWLSKQLLYYLSLPMIICDNNLHNKLRVYFANKSKTLFTMSPCVWVASLYLKEGTSYEWQSLTLVAFKSIRGQWNLWKKGFSANFGLICKTGKFLFEELWWNFL